jgi:hypothetical protein
MEELRQTYKLVITSLTGHLIQTLTQPSQPSRLPSLPDAGVTFCKAHAQATANGMPSETVDDPLSSQQWDVKAINVPEVWGQWLYW